MLSQAELSDYYDMYMGTLVLQREAEQALSNAQRVLQDARDDAIVDASIQGSVLGKNAEAREAALNVRLRDQLNDVRAAEDNVTGTRMQAESARIRVEKALALMRAQDIDLRAFDREQTIIGSVRYDKF